MRRTSRAAIRFSNAQPSTRFSTPPRVRPDKYKVHTVAPPNSRKGDMRPNLAHNDTGWIRTAFLMRVNHLLRNNRASTQKGRHRWSNFWRKLPSDSAMSRRLDDRIGRIISPTVNFEDRTLLAPLDLQFLAQRIK